MIKCSNIRFDDIYVKTQMREAMKTPEFWAQYKAANPTVDTSQWSKEIQERFNKKINGN